MLTQGIRILDTQDNILDVDLSDILNEINGEDFYWSILFLDGYFRDRTTGEYISEINNSKNGLFIDWNELLQLSKKFTQIFEVILIASKQKSKLKFFENEKEMYETCDYTLELSDCTFWEVYSKNKATLEKLKNKFKRTEWI